MTGVRRNALLTSSFCCCSLKIKDTGLLARYYSTPGYQDGRRSRDLMRETRRSMDTSERIAVRRRLNSFTCPERKSSSMKRFEPCYQQIYPSKKRKATFKIPKKTPYIPAVYQRKPTSYRNKYQEMVSGAVTVRHTQWPPLYPCKKKDRPQAQSEKTRELPPWLLPLYSFKACPSEETPSISEVRYSGSAFQRKMEIAESFKHIRAKQDVLSQIRTKEAKKDDKTRHDAGKSSDAVEALKKRIGSMKSYLSTVKDLEAYRKRVQTKTNESELAENQEIIRQAYSRIYQTKPPSLPREVRVRKSLGLDIVGSNAFENPLPGTSNQVSEQTVQNLEHVDIMKGTSTSKIQYNGEKKHEGEPNSSQQIVNNKHTPVVRNNNLSLGQIHTESVVMIKQPSWKKQQTMNGQIENDTKTLRATPNDTKEKNAKDIPTVNKQSYNINARQIKPQEDAGNAAANAWTVESLKTRINVMKINKTIDETITNKAEDMSGTRNGGEIRPKISQVALESFHKEVGSKYPINAQLKEVTRSRLGYRRTVGRRNFSTCRHPMTEPVATVLGNRRKIFSSSQATTSKKKTWINRIKRCFVLERTRGPKCLNWKTVPREIPYEKKEDECNSPAPILWKPSELDENLRKHSSSKPTHIIKERVNPATLNAEQRVLAGISKLMTTKPQSIPGFRAIDIEKKISRAKHKVNMMPWLKESKSYDNERRSLPLKRCDKVELDEPQGSGYEWILKNKELVEDLKRQSRYAAGKSLVPVEVKNSINQYKLPLKAEISKYRKKIDQKCTDIFVYSTSKRWYSTCYAGKHRRILPCSDVFQVKKRGIKTNEHRNRISNPGKLIDRKTRSDIEVGISLRRYNQGVDNLGRRNDGPSQNPEEECRSKKWAWKIPNKTRSFPTRLPLTSPNKAAATTMSEMSTFVLKKQVEELKRLIKKAREEDIDEKIEESPMESQPGDNYETRLKRLIKAAHNNAEKMQIVEPKYTSENNLLADKPPKGEKVNPRPMIQYDAKPDKCKSETEVSVLKSLFKKTIGEPESLADEIARRNNMTVLPGSSKKPEKTMSSRVYIKLKSLVEAVRKRSAMLDAIDTKLLPTPHLKGNMSRNAAPPSLSGKRTEGSENMSNEVHPEPVELLAEMTQAPSNTIQLWKGESKPREFNVFKEKEPTYGDLMNLFAKAKEIFYYQPPEVDTNAQGTETVGDRQSETLSHRELSKNWLSIREDVSNAARAVSEKKVDPPERLESSHTVSSLLNPQSKLGADSLPAFLMNTPRMLPGDLLKSNTKMSCDHMWSNIPVSIQENEDLCGKTSSGIIDASELPSQHSEPSSVSPPTPKIPITEATTTQTGISQHEQSVILEPTKFQKPLTTWESISHKFGSSLGRNLFGKPVENRSNTEQEAVFNENQITHPNPKAEDNPIGERPKSSNFETTQTRQHDTNAHCQSPENQRSSQSSATPAGNVPELDSQHNNTVSCTHGKGTDMGSIKDLHFVPNIGPLEESVRTYENYYRHHFAEDIISSYEHLHLVYSDLNKISDLNKCNIVGSNKTQSKEGKEANSHISNPIINAPLKNTAEGAKTLNSSVDEKIVDSDFQGSAEMQTEKQCPATKPGRGVILGGTEEVVSGRTQGNASGIVYNENEQDLDVSSHGISNANEIEHLTSNQSGEETSRNITFKTGKRMMKINGQYEAFKESGETEAHERIESEVLAASPDKKTNAEDNSTTSNNEFGDQQEKTTNFDHLLMHDPTLNFEVVKKLKLPVVISDESHAEKNWYTKFQSGSQHDQ